MMFTNDKFSSSVNKPKYTIKQTGVIDQEVIGLT